MKKGRKKLYESLGGIVTVWVRHEDLRFFCWFRPHENKPHFYEFETESEALSVAAEYIAGYQAALRDMGNSDALNELRRSA